MSRQPFCTAFVATTGTGKSTKAEAMAKKLSPNKVLVVTYNGEPKIWRKLKKVKADKKGLSFEKGWRHVQYADLEEETLQNIYKYYRNGLVIFDDCLLYLKSDWRHTKGLKELVINHRHIMLDMFFIAHSPNQIPPQVWAFIRFAFLGKCTTKYNTRDVNVSEPEKFEKTLIEIGREYDKRVNAGQPPYGIFKCVKL